MKPVLFRGNTKKEIVSADKASFKIVKNKQKEKEEKIKYNASEKSSYLRHREKYFPNTPQVQKEDSQTVVNMGPPRELGSPQNKNY